MAGSKKVVKAKAGRKRTPVEEALNRKTEVTPDPNGDQWGTAELERQRREQHEDIREFRAVSMKEAEARTCLWNALANLVAHVGVIVYPFMPLAEAAAKQAAADLERKSK